MLFQGRTLLLFIAVLLLAGATLSVLGVRDFAESWEAAAITGALILLLVVAEARAQRQARHRPVKKTGSISEKQRSHK